MQTKLIFLGIPSTLATGRERRGQAFLQGAVIRLDKRKKKKERNYHEQENYSVISIQGSQQTFIHTFTVMVLSQIVCAWSPRPPRGAETVCNITPTSCTVTPETYLCNQNVYKHTERKNILKNEFICVFQLGHFILLNTSNTFSAIRATEQR